MFASSLLLLANVVANQPDCSESLSHEGRVGLHNCLSQQLDDVNQNLRIAWVSALERAKMEDERKKKDSILEFQDDFSSVKSLTQAQKGWNIYRDNHCNTQELSMWPGNGGISLYLNCMIKLGEARIAELKDFSVNG